MEDQDHREAAVEDSCWEDVDHELLSCSGTWVFSVLIMASGVHQIEESCGRRRRRRPQKKKTAVDVVDVDVVVDVGGRLEQPRRLFFNC